MYDYREQGGYTEWEELDKTSLIVEQSWHCRANQQWPPWSKINCRERVYAAPAYFQPGTNATFLYCTFIRVLGTVSRGVLWNLPARLLPVWNTYVSMIINKYIPSEHQFVREYVFACVSMILETMIRTADYQSMEQRLRKITRKRESSTLFRTVEIAFITSRVKTERRYYSEREKESTWRDRRIGEWNLLVMAPLTKSHQLRTRTCFTTLRVVRATTFKRYQFGAR